jgi:hypothetical protein
MKNQSSRTRGEWETARGSARKKLPSKLTRGDNNVFAVDKEKLKPLPSYKLLPKHKVKLDYEKGWSFQRSVKRLRDPEGFQKLQFPQM